MSNPEPESDEEDDELTKLAVKLVSEVAEAIDLLAEKSEESPDVFVQVARGLNPGAISRRSTLVLDDIERLIRADNNVLLSPAEELQDWSEIAFRYLPAGWLRANMTHEILELERALRDSRSAALSYGRFWQNNAGIGGIVKRAVGGYLNPLDGWMNLVGKSTSQTEESFLVSELADAFSELGNSTETVSEDLALKIRLKFSEISSAVG